MTEGLPLSGLRVVEFSHMVMGPSCGLILADLGADVIKIEPAPNGDKTRRLPGSGAGFFVSFNRNKRSLALDLKTPEGIAIVKRLIAHADIVTENFRPGGLDAMGLGYEALAQAHPRLIYCSMKGFLSGPYEDRAALDEVVQMMGGLAYMTGPPGRPLRAGSSVNDIMGGMFAVIAILAALQERHRSGRGQYVKSALFESNMFLVAQHMMQFAVTGKAAAPMPARISAWGVYDVFDTEDASQIFVGIVSDTQWHAFCDAFAQPDLKIDPELATNSLRVAARDRLIPRLRALFASMTRADIAALCEATRLPYAPIMRPEDMFDDPHLNAPGAMIEIGLGDGRHAPVPALPIEMDGARLGLRHDVPTPGKDSAAILHEIGMAQDEIDALAARGIVRLS